MAYNPVNPNGQATSANSAPVVIASDQSAVAVSVSGVATAANQTTGNTSLSSIDGKITAVNTGAVVVSSSALPALAATSTKQSDGSQKTQIVDGSGNVIASTGNALDINIASSEVSSATAGDVASGSADSGNPVKIGALAKTAWPTSVSDAQRVNLVASKSGSLMTAGAMREMKGAQKTTITSSTAETTIVTSDATYTLDLYGLIIANTSASNCKVTIKDSTAGTTRFIIQVPAADTRGFMLPVDSAHKQNAASNNWTATCGSSVADIEITAMYVKTL